MGACSGSESRPFSVIEDGTSKAYSLGGGYAFPCSSDVSVVYGHDSDPKTVCYLDVAHSGFLQWSDLANEFDGQFSRSPAPEVFYREYRFKMVWIDARGNRAQMVHLIAQRNLATKLRVVSAMRWHRLPVQSGGTISISVLPFLPNPARRFISTALLDVIGSLAVVVVNEVHRLTGGISALRACKWGDFSWLPTTAHARPLDVLGSNSMRERGAMTYTEPLVMAFNVARLVGGKVCLRSRFSASALTLSARIRRNYNTAGLREPVMADKILHRLALDVSKAFASSHCKVGFVAASAMTVAKSNFHHPLPVGRVRHPGGSRTHTPLIRQSALLA